MQAFLGRTGKEGLKRQVTTLEPSKVNLNTADYAERVYLSKSDLDSIRDVSAGAATFYVWVRRIRFILILNCLGVSHSRIDRKYLAIHTHVHTYTRTYINAYTRTYIHAYTRTYIHAYIHSYIPT